MSPPFPVDHLEDLMSFLIDLDPPSSALSSGDQTRPPSSQPGSSSVTESRASVESGADEFDDYDNSSNNRNPDLSHVTSQPSSFNPSSTCSPLLLYGGNSSSGSMFPPPPPPPPSTMWSTDTTSNPLAETYGSNATVSNTIGAPNFIAPTMPGFSLIDYQDPLWPQDNSSYSLGTVNELDATTTMFLPPPSLPPRGVQHSRAYSESTLPTAATMNRGLTTYSEGSFDTSEDDRMTGASILSSLPLQHRTRSGRRVSVSTAGDSSNDRTPIRRRRSTRGTSRAMTAVARGNSGARGGGSGFSQAVSAPTSPELTRQRDTQPQGPFTCPLSPYGCESHFWSKNEWKRHVITKHLRLGYYLCELCPSDGMRAQYQNPRKDLFTQHIWRMHIQAEDQSSSHSSHQHSHSSRPHSHSPVMTTSALRRTSSGGGQVTEAVTDRYGDIYTRCWVQMRQPPQEAYCVFCGERFRGPAGCENWLEHVGRQHLAHLQPGRRSSSGSGTSTAHTTGPSVAMPGFTHAEWLNDSMLQTWLVQHGEIVWDVQRNGFVLATESPTSATPIMTGSDTSTTPTASRPGTRRTSTINTWGMTSEAIIEEAPDAEGEPDFDFPDFVI